MISRVVYDRTIWPVYSVNLVYKPACGDHKIVEFTSKYKYIDVEFSADNEFLEIRSASKSISIYHSYSSVKKI